MSLYRLLPGHIRLKIGMLEANRQELNSFRYEVSKIKFMVNIHYYHVINFTLERHKATQAYLEPLKLGKGFLETHSDSARWYQPTGPPAEFPGMN